MSSNYFLDMTSEDDVIDPSSLTKFRKLHLKDNDLLNLLINKTIPFAIEKGIVSSKSIIVDTTHTLSRSYPFLAIDVLRERSKLLQKTIYPFDNEYKEQMPQKNTDNDLEKKLTYYKELETHIKNEPSISSTPTVKEKLNLLKETVEDIKENFILSKDTDAKTGHKPAHFAYKLYFVLQNHKYTHYLPNDCPILIMTLHTY